jgi:hypothetical protein
MPKQTRSPILFLKKGASTATRILELKNGCGTKPENSNPLL